MRVGRISLVNKRRRVGRVVGKGLKIKVWRSSARRKGRRGGNGANGLMVRVDRKGLREGEVGCQGHGRYGVGKVQSQWLELTCFVGLCGGDIVQALYACEMGNMVWI